MQPLKLKTADIKQFFAASKHIRSSSILPILAYILWDGNTLTRSNLKTFTRSTIESTTPEPILLELKSLNAILSTTTSEEITITKKGDTIILSDDGNMSVKFQIGARDVYPVMPTAPALDQWYTLGKEFADVINKAAKFVGEIDNNLQFVHVYTTDKNLFVYGTDGTKMLAHLFAKGDADINFQLDGEGRQLFAAIKDESFYFTKADNYDFFKFGDNVHAFAQSELKTWDITHLWDAFYNDPAEKVQFPAIELSNFCNLVQAICVLPYSKCNINGAEVQFSDNDRGAGVNETLPHDLPRFAFNHKMLQPCLDVIGSNYATVKKVDKAYVLQMDAFPWMVITLQGLMQNPQP